MVFLFWTSFFLIIYTYACYPSALWLVSTVRAIDNDELLHCDEYPKVSIVISARNEQLNIERRLLNFLEQTYPSELLELIVVSDGSSDNTAAILRELIPTLESSGLGHAKVIELTDNEGKPNALNLAVKSCQNEIIVMADARQTFHPNAIMALVGAIQDPQVGCVSGELHLLSSEGESGSGVEMGLYWRYERFIRRTESRITSVVGMTGAIYAIRKSLYQDIPKETLIDDVLIPMNVIRQGFRAKFTSSAIAYDRISANPIQEWQRKSRTMAGNWQLIFQYPWLLSPRKNPAFLSFLSHKVLRLLVPFLIATAILSGFLLQQPIYAGIASALVAGLLVGLLGLVFPPSRRLRIVSLAFFFMTLNAAVVAGLYKYVHPSKNLLWTDAHKGQAR